MIIYTKADASVSIPVGLGPNVAAVEFNLQDKEVDSSTELQVVRKDLGYDGLSSVTVNPYELDAKTVNSSTEIQTVTSDKDGLSSVTVNPYTLDTKTVNSSTETQTVTSDADGLSSVTVNPYTLESATVNSSTEAQTLTPSADGFSSVTVNPYTLDSKTVNSSTVSQTVTSDADGLSSVTVTPYVLDTKTVDPSINAVTVTSDEDGLSSVTVNAITAAIDPDLVAGNIKKDVEILGVTGSFEGGALQSKTVNSSTVSQTVSPDGTNYGLSSVTVNPYIVESKSDTITVNGQYSYSPSNSDALSGVTIDVQVADIPAVVQTKSVTYNHNGNYTVTKDAGYDGMSSVSIEVDVDDTVNLEPAKTVNSSTVSQTVTYDSTQYDGLSSVTVNPYTLENKTVNSSTVQQTISASTADGLAQVTIEPYTLDSKTVDPSTVSQTVTSSNDGLSSVTVNAVDSNIDPNILSNNIKNGVTILGITGSYVGQVINNQNKTVDSSTVSQSITADNGYTGLGTVTVNPYTTTFATVTSTTNGQTQHIIPSTYYGTDAISGITVNPVPTQYKNVDPSVNIVYVSPDSGYTLTSVGVNAVTSSIDSNIQAGNIKNGVTILGVTGTYNPSGDYIYETKTGVRTSLTTDFAGLTDQMYGAYSLFNYCNTLESLTATMERWGNTSNQKLYMMGRLCLGCENLENVNFPNWTGLGNATGQFYQAFANCPKLTSVNFPEMTFADGFEGTFGGSGDYSADASANFGKLERIGDYGMANCFSNSGFTSINMPLLDTVYRKGLNSAFAGPDTSIGSMTFPSLTTCPNANWSALDPTISSAFEIAFINNPNITSVSFPELTTVGNQCFSETFYNATGLTTLSMPKLSTFEKGSFSNAFPFRLSSQDNTRNFLYNCTSLVNLTIHPNCLVYEILAGAPNIANLTITDNITDNVRLDWQSSLTSASVLNVLSYLDLNTSGKTVTFYTGGLIVYDNAQGEIQATYNAAINAGWTINNLIIMPNLIDTTTDLTSLGNNLTSSQIEELLNHVDTTYVLGRTLTFATGSNYEAESYSSSLYQKYVNLGTTSGWTMQNLFIGFPDYTGWSSDGKYRHYEFDFGTGQRNAVIESDYKGYSNSYMEHVGTAISYYASDNIWLETNDGGKTKATIGAAPAGSSGDKIESSTNNTSGTHTTAFGVLDDGRMILKPRANGTGLVISETTSGMLQAGSSNLRLPCKDFRFNNNTRSWNILGFRVWHNWGTTGDRSDSATLVHDVVHIKDFQWNRYKMHDRVTDRWYDLIVENS